MCQFESLENNFKGPSLYKLIFMEQKYLMFFIHGYEFVNLLDRTFNKAFFKLLPICDEK